MKRAKTLRDILQTEDEARLIFLLETTEPDLQTRICSELGRRKSKGAIEPLRRRLGAPDWKIREAAAEALGKIGDPLVGEDILRLFADENQSTQVRDTCAYALARLAYRPALPQLLSALADPAPSVRACAVAALAAIGDSSVRNSVSIASETERDATVRDAMRALLASLRRSQKADAVNVQYRLLWKAWVPESSNRLLAVDVWIHENYARFRVERARSGATPIGGGWGSELYGAEVESQHKSVQRVPSQPGYSLPLSPAVLRAALTENPMAANNG
jgi:HEAT repeat protein